MERTIDRVVRQLDDMPRSQVENLKHASKDELAEEFITLRLFVSNLYLWCKDVREDYKLLHERLNEIQRDSHDITALLRSMQEENEALIRRMNSIEEYHN